jgi:hypothetical protein
MGCDVRDNHQKVQPNALVPGAVKASDRSSSMVD